MKKLNFKNIFTIKLSVCFTLLFCIVVTIAVICITTYIMSTMKNVIGDYENNIHSLQTGLATSYIQILQEDIDKKDFTYTKKLSFSMLENNIFRYIYAKDTSNNKVIEGAEPDGELLTSTKQVEVPVRDNVSIFYGFKTIENDIFQSNVAKIYLNIIIVVLVTSIIASILLSDIISRPLERLSKAAKEITDGNFNIKIEKSIFSEINDLIYTYNEMGFQLNELYSSLELKVQERTIALEEANYKLQETQAMMVHSEKMRSLGELVAGIAHEINNPVNFIHGNIMILQNYADDLLKLIDLYGENENLPEELKTKIENLKKEIDLDFLRDDIKDLIKSCIEGTQRTKNIVLDLKNFSRMEEMVLTEFDIPKEIDTTLNILNNKYKNRITVVKNYDPNLPKIEAYGGQLNQVFMNILDNAQDAMGESGTLTINASKIDENVRIEFIDTGSGIAKEHLAKVFDPFFTTKAVGKGTGLGMSISYRVINDHKGKIEVESEVGKGTKFIITLPINHEQKQDLMLNDDLEKDLRTENGAQ